MIKDRAQAQGLSAPTGLAPVKGAKRAATAMRASEGSRAWEAERERFRKYACGTTTSWKTMHARGEMGRATTVARTVRHPRVKQSICWSRGQDGR
eukprot:3987751-Pleurochrysis_carterae.AAC.3